MDASFHQKTGGAWAVWLRSGTGRAVRRGICPSYVRDSNAAELSAIYASVYLARAIWPSTTGVLVCSDCQSALAAAAPSASLSSDPAVRRLQQRLRELAHTERLELRFKWVKGHQRSRTSTSAWLNNQVDRLARSTRRAARSVP
jgi:ribonuclease HI